MVSLEGSEDAWRKKGRRGEERIIQKKGCAEIKNKNVLEESTIWQVSEYKKKGNKR